MKKKTIFSLIVLTALIFILFNSCSDKNANLKSEILSFAESNSDLPIIKNLYYLIELEQLFSDGGHEAWFFRERTFQVIMDSITQIKIVNYSPAYRYGYDEVLISSNYMKPITGSGILIDYDLIFYFNQNEQLDSVKAIARLKMNEYENMLVLDQHSGLLFSDFSMPDKIDEQKRYIEIKKAKKEQLASDKKEMEDILTISSYDNSILEVKQYLKENYLKDPDSYESIEWSDVVIEEGKEYKYMVRHKFRAKNSFGGYVIENKVFYIDANGKVFDFSDYN